MDALLLKTLRNFQHFMLDQVSDICSDVQDGLFQGYTGLQIYRTGYYLRLLEVLTYDFMMLKKAMGATVFNRLGRVYIKEYPSREVVVSTFSKHFPVFLKIQKTVSEKHRELAEFEWALKQSRVIAATSNMTSADIHAIPPSEWFKMRFIINPSLVEFHSDWRAPHRWRALQADSLFLDDSSVKTEQWLIWSKSGNACFQELTPSAHCFLKALQTGAHFGQVCEALCEVMPQEEVGQFAARYLNQWILEHILVDFSFEDIL